VGHLDPEETEAATDQEAGGEGEGVAEGIRLSVTEWREADNSGATGVIVIGQVRNVISETLMGAGLVVRLLDDDGSVLATADATLSSRQLAPRANASFRADFPDQFSYSRVEFETVGLALRTRNEEEEPAGVPAVEERGEPSTS
jgi:hypothetical protein